MKIHWVTLVSNSILDDDGGGKWSEAYKLSAIATFWGLGGDWKPSQRERHASITIVSGETGCRASKLFSGHIMFTISGRACDTIGTDALLEMMCKMAWNYHVTRIDVAHDLSGVSAAEIWTDFSPTSALNRKRKTAFMVDEVGSATAYFGSRTSDVYVRCYDRGAYLRFETEAKGSVARALLVVGMEPDTLLSRLHGISARGEALVNSPILSDALEQAGVTVGIWYPADDAGSDDETRMRWFSEQVIPAFSKLASHRTDAAEQILARLNDVLSGSRG